MKKLLSMLLALILLLNLTACDTQEDSSDHSGDEPAGTTQPTEPHTHSYTEVVTEPTCTEDGYTTHTCTCGDSYVDNYVATLGHDWGYPDKYGCNRCSTSLMPSRGLRMDGFGMLTLEGLGSCADTFLVIPAYESSNVIGASRDYPVTKIAANAFKQENAITCVFIPYTVEVIETGALLNCPNLTNVYVDSKNENYHISGNCLIETQTKTLIWGCETSRIPTDGSVIKIGEGAFSGCSSLTSIVIPGCITEIEDDAFKDCTGLESVTLQEGVLWISDSFMNCSNLTTITIPQSLWHIGSGAFWNCGMLNNVIYTGTAEQWNSNELSSVFGDVNVSFAGGNSGEDDPSQGGTDTDDPSQGGTDTIETILKFELNGSGNYTVSGIEAAQAAVIEIPEQYNGKDVTAIAADAFKEFTWLTMITIPGSVKSVGRGAFYGCTNLTTIIYDTQYGDWSTDWNAGADNSKVYISDYDLDFELSEDGKSYEVTGLGINSGGTIVIPKTYNGLPVAAIGESAFKGHGDYWDVNVSKVVVLGDITVKKEAFYFNYHLSEFICIGDVLEVGDRAFYACRKLTSIALSGTTKIGSQAFISCTNLSSIVLPETLTDISWYAFQNCSLSRITFTGTKAQWNAINKGTDWDFMSGVYTVYCTDGEIKK